MQLNYSTNMARIFQILNIEEASVKKKANGLSRRLILKPEY